MMKYTAEVIMELQEEREKYCATKVELMAFREETAINFGKVNVAIAKTQADLSAAIAKSHTELSAAIAKTHTELSAAIVKTHTELSANAQVGIASLKAEIAAMEVRMVKWSIATAIALAGAAFAIARLVH